MLQPETKARSEISGVKGEWLNGEAEDFQERDLPTRLETAEGEISGIFGVSMKICRSPKWIRSSVGGEPPWLVV